MAPPDGPTEGPFSPRLTSLLADILEGRAPNAGRFCGHCYHPLAQERQACPHCGQPTAARPPVARIPQAVLEMYRAQRRREAWVVQGLAWGGLITGVVVGLLPLALGGATWWTVLAFFAIMGFFYILSANVANSLGDALGYRWGQSVARRRWQRFVAQRDSGPSDL